MASKIPGNDLQIAIANPDPCTPRARYRLGKCTCILRKSLLCLIPGLKTTFRIAHCSSQNMANGKIARMKEFLERPRACSILQGSGQQIALQ
jgi:hypothetical protein